MILCKIHDGIERPGLYILLRPPPLADRVSIEDLVDGMRCWEETRERELDSRAPLSPGARTCDGRTLNPNPSTKMNVLQYIAPVYEA